MSIESNAAPSEKSSPFYIANEKLCYVWSDYILEKNGKINGSFNASSLSIKSKVKTNFTWLIDVKKATFSSGHLLLSSKYQNLQEILMFRTIIANTDCDDFSIKKSRFRGHSKNHKFSRQIIELLEEGFKNNSLYEVKFHKSELTIVFHYKNDWFEIANRILAFKYSGTS